MKASFVSAAVFVQSVSALSLLPLTEITQLLTDLGPAPANDARFTNWVAPGPDDSRSPCPGLNAAANHGFINHNGRDLNLPDLITGLAASMNIGADFTTLIGAVGLSSSPNPLGGTFDLSDLDQHNFPIEHDASISRQDAYFGNDYSFNQTEYDQYFNYFGNKTTSDIKSVAYAKDIRYRDSLKRNPTFTFGLRETVLSFGENGLWVQTLGDPSSGVTNLSYAHMFFEQEKFPYELGWRPSPQPITLVSLGAMILEFYAAGPEPIPEGVEIVADSYKNLLQVLGGGEEVVANLTQGISTILGL